MAVADKEVPAMLGPLKETHVSIIYQEDHVPVEPVDIVFNGEEYPEEGYYGRLSQITFS